MKKIYKETLEGGMIELPESAGVVLFCSKKNIMMCRMTSNISRFLDIYFNSDIEDGELGEMLEKCDIVAYQESSKVFGALLGMKTLVQEFSPPYNQTIRYYDGYYYLGLNFLKVPFIKLKSTTIHDYFYLGPFRSRFILHDVIDAICEHFGTPDCPGEEFPCKLSEMGRCRGYCVHDKDKLLPDLVKYYLLPEAEHLKILEEKRGILLDSLRFTEAEINRRQQELIREFYGKIAFLMVTRHLNLVYEYEGKKIEITSGMISRIDDWEFEYSNQENEANELYAVDKSELDERWIVYNHVMRHFPEKLKAGYDITRGKLAAYLSYKDS
jgi:excinuclease UvrABC nuclease subunit